MEAQAVQWPESWAGFAGEGRAVPMGSSSPRVPQIQAGGHGAYCVRCSGTQSGKEWAWDA